MREVTLAATQMTCSKDTSENVDKAEKLIREMHLVREHKSFLFKNYLSQLIFAWIKKKNCLDYQNHLMDIQL